MRDVGYIVAGYALTGGVVAAYAVSVGLRVRRTARRLRQGFPRGGAS